jgi:cysteine desulfurase
MARPLQATAGMDETPAPIFLDYQSTTPTDPRVVDVMLPYFGQAFGNPHSRSHAFGQAASQAVERARAHVAAAIGAEAREVVFTSGATEANNLAIKGVLAFQHGRKDHVIASAVEHKCVLESCRRLAREGVRLTVLPVDAGGLVDPDAVARAIEPGTALVSVMAVNNEVGTIQPLAEIGAICRARGVLFHTDAAQAVGKIALDVGDDRIDLMSISAHKLYGPKGIGALYVRRRPRARLAPLIDGGGQERGLRSGTLPTPLCVGFGEACRLATAERESEAARLHGLRERLWHGLRTRVEGMRLNGDAGRRIAGNLNFAVAGVDAEELMLALPELALSSGSACTSAAIEPSYVLKALGLDDETAHSSLRIGLGRFTARADVDVAIERIASAVARLRAGQTGRSGGASGAAGDVALEIDRPARP